MSLLLSLSSAAILFASSAGAPAAPALPAASSTKPSAGAHTAASQGALPWIEDDYARAIAEGKRRGVPVFVEAWAPW